MVAWSVESDEEDVLLEGAMTAELAAISRLFRLTWLLDSTAKSQLPSSADPVMPIALNMYEYFFTIGHNYYDLAFVISNSKGHGYLQ